MLKFRKILLFIQNILIFLLLLLSCSMFYIRYKMFNIINDLSYLDKEIERINDDKKILTIELTYLTSTERLLSLIDKNPELLNNKKIVDVKQIKTKDELKKISLSKAMKNPYKNKKYARAMTDLIQNEI